MVDMIGFLCPFLVVYGIMCPNEEYAELAITGQRI